MNKLILSYFISSVCFAQGLQILYLSPGFMPPPQYNGGDGNSLCGAYGTEKNLDMKLFLEDVPDEFSNAISQSVSNTNKMLPTHIVFFFCTVLVAEFKRHIQI